FMGPNFNQKTPVSEEDKQKSYFKFYEREAAPIFPPKMGKVFGPPMNPMAALPFAERAKILDADYANDEIGYCAMFDGTGYVSDVNFIPGGTAEMIDWWYNWRGLDPLRYVIANPNEFIQSRTMQSAKAVDEDLTIQERYWDTTQTVIKKGVMKPAVSYLNFKYPGNVGFDMSKIGADQYTKSLICIRYYDQGQPPAAGPDTFIVHQVVEKDGGVEVRTKMWIGYTVRYGLDYKALPDEFRMTPVVPQPYLIANAVEWANVAAILPELYAAEKDNL
ncbi:MAG: hypothetical protein HUJ76_08130, partial [Parasporobacterium sp.]|nr:hypothetical protein [Parasporobacterium sp.]